MSTQLQVYQEPIAPLSRSDAFFELLYGAHMKAFPKRTRSKTKSRKNDTDREWIFVGEKERMKSIATQSTLFAVLADPAVDTTYYTPNGYYRRDLRQTETLRWLNAYIFDLDTRGESLADILDRFDQAGLPRPTAIIQTPSGGYHGAIFFTKPVRATARAIRLYTAIMSHMAIDLGADTAAIGANRIFRTPTEQNLIYFEPDNRYDFEVLKTWREINHTYDPETAGYVNIHTGDLMSHPALEKLLEAPCSEGKREQTAFNLALAMKASDWSQEEAESALRVWFNSCCSKGSQAGKDPFTLRDAVYKASYVFGKASLFAPTADMIRELTGLPFYYQLRNNWECAKPRAERERSHLHEWESDLLELLKSESELTGTQQELATRLNCPQTSFKAVLSQLKAAGSVIVETRRGRNGMTVIRLPETPEKGPETNQKGLETNNVIVLPVNENEELEVEMTVIVYVDFRERKIQRAESVRNAKIAPEQTDPDPPD